MPTRPELHATRIVVLSGALLLSAIACARPTPTDPISTSLASVPAELRALLENVSGATRIRYDARDDRGHELDGLAITAAPDGGFVGVSHWWSEPTAEFRLGLATSDDLLNWTWRAELARRASMPAIAAASDGGYVVAWEQEPDNHLRVRLVSAPGTISSRPDRRRRSRRSQRLSDCAEGTPNLTRASSTAVEFDYHYYADCDLDREARGATDWTAWSSQPRPELDAAILAHGVKGGIGDRDTIAFRGREFTLIEAMSVRDDWSTWRIYLVDEMLSAAPLAFATDGGSRAFTNPTAEVVELNGRPTLFVSLFVPMEGGAGGEVGELLYYVPLPDG